MFFSCLPRQRILQGAQREQKWRLHPCPPGTDRVIENLAVLRQRRVGRKGKTAVLPTVTAPKYVTPGPVAGREGKCRRAI